MSVSAGRMPALAGGCEIKSGEGSFTEARTASEGIRFAFSGATRIPSARASGLSGVGSENGQEGVFARKKESEPRRQEAGVCKGTEPSAFGCHAASENGQEGVFARKRAPPAGSRRLHGVVT